MISFTKMDGAGNDFVVLDNRDGRYQLSREAIARLCDRHRGVGADGLMLVEPAEKGATARMRYYNSDGGEAEMCGNGARCFARFLKRLLDDVPTEVTFETIAGVIGATFPDDAGNVRIELSDPVDLKLHQEIALPNGTSVTTHSVNTGVPHAVVFVEDLPAVDIVPRGAGLRYHAHFAPAGTNANFACVEAPGVLSIRTYERGVEDETLACGTGMAACALIHHALEGGTSPVTVKVAGGDTLYVGFEKDGDTYRRVTLTGPAAFVFEGILASGVI